MIYLTVLTDNDREFNHCTNSTLAGIMERKTKTFKVEVSFSKNRHYPQYGSEAYSIESYSIYIPYGKKCDFKTSNQAIVFIKDRLNSNELGRFDSIYITKWRGYTGTCECIKTSMEKSDTTPIDKTFAEAILTY